MAEFKLGAVSIFELGDVINKKLIEDGVDGEAVLTIEVPEDKFGKVDEDLYYRTRKKDDVFIPSENEIIASYSRNVKIVIKKHKKNEKH